MSRTAVLISGQLRTFAQCYPTQRWQVYRHFPDPHFFILVENNDQVNSVQALRRDYGHDRVHAKFIDDPTDLPTVPDHLGAHAPYANATTHANLMMQHWYQNEVWKWFCERADGSDFGHLIRMRGDNFFHYYEPWQIYSGTHNLVVSPWWGRFGGMNDRFAIIGKEAAKDYFTLYTGIETLLREGCPFHPESLLLAWIQRGGSCRVSHTLNAMFSTLRLPKPHPQNPAQMVQEIRFPEIQPHETAEYARSKF